MFIITSIIPGGNANIIYRQEMMEREVGLKKLKATLTEKEWVERFTKKEEKKKQWVDPNNTFKP